jgi:hypothetical protein
VGEAVQLLLILDLGTKWIWVVSVTPRPRFTPGTHCIGGRAPIIRLSPRAIQPGARSTLRYGSQATVTKEKTEHIYICTINNWNKVWLKLQIEFGLYWIGTLQILNFNEIGLVISQTKHSNIHIPRYIFYANNNKNIATKHFPGFDPRTPSWSFCDTGVICKRSDLFSSATLMHWLLECLLNNNRHSDGHLSFNWQTAGI